MNSIQGPPVALPSLDDPFYYLANFETVLAWVGERYRDLLTAPERAFIEEFSALPRASRALLVRMVMRKGSVFRASRLRYAEIGTPRDAVTPLLEKGWVDATPTLSLEQLFELLTKAEIVALFRAQLETPSATKPALLEALRPRFEAPRRFAVWWPASEDSVFALTLMDLCDRLRLMFFGNLRQDWSTFVLADLGVHRYERVEFTPGSRAFHNRADVDAYLHLHRCRERLEAGEPLADVLDAIPPRPSDNDWIETRRAKLLFRIAHEHERAADLATALRLYADCPHPGARLRRLRVLERRGELEAALALAHDALRLPESVAETQHLERLLPRLRRKLGLSKPQRRPSAPVERIDVTLERPAEGVSVERAVREHVSEPQAPVHYVENTLINSLFGLLCWEAIFAPVPGAFFHPFHSGPADLLRPGFRQQRATLFDACLAQLDTDTYQATIRETYAAKRGIQSPFVHWAVVDEALLDQALACLPRQHLKRWFERLLQDIKSNRAGLPDLIQFWPGEDGAQPRYRMIEVKGPGDRLQDNQLRWLAFCAEHRMPVAVCYVRWAEIDEPGTERVAKDAPR